MRSERSRVTALDRYRNSLQHVHTLSPDAERRLAQAWSRGDERAGRALVESSLPFVIRIAQEYRRWGVPLEDLIQQGNLGLLKAARKYDTTKKCRLVTYAVYWIRAEIRDYVVRCYRIVRLGSTRTERRAMRMYRRSGVASWEELAASSGMPKARARALWPLLASSDVSLDFRVGDRTPMERLATPQRDPEELLMKRDNHRALCQAVDEAKDHLTDREKRIMSERLMSETPLTLQQLGTEMGVSKERVRQLEARLCEKLRGRLAEFGTAAA